ncbi:MAG TPA: PAS domain S-box protein [Candidatus Sulfotelmatobacter sp.]|nr:PAS domain S-box protein [Candidatus Sulfotelmatobacter sp.]
MMQDKSQPNEPADGGASSTPLPSASSPRSSATSNAAAKESVSQTLSASQNQSSSENPFSYPGDGESGVNKELRRLNRALRTLSGCNQALARAGSEPELLGQICEIIVSVGGYRMAFIGYAEVDEQRSVKPMAQAGNGEEYLTRIALQWSDTEAGRGPVGTAIRENRICLVADTASDAMFAPWREAAMERGYAAVIALPLRSAGAALGVLAIYSEQAGSFEASEQELLTEMANNLSYGITAIRSREEGKRATAALRDAEEKYRQLVEQVPAISYVAEAGAQGRFLYVSPQVSTILGYRPEDCMLDPWFWWNHLNPEDHPTAQLEDSWEEGHPFRVEYRMRAQDGREVWLRDEAVIVRDPHSGKRLTRGLLIEITERKRADEALRRSEENYRLFVAQSSEGIFRLDLDEPVSIELAEEELARHIVEHSRMAECNDAMAQMYGLSSPAELLGKRLSELLPEEAGGAKLTREYVRNGFRLLERERREMDVHRNPKIFLNSMFGVVERGRLLRTWGIQRDITERLKAEEARQTAEEALRESEERYRAFVGQSSEGIFRMEYNPPVPCGLPVAEQLALGRKNGVLAECNDALARMYGRGSAAELMGKPLAEFLVLNDPGTRKFMEKFIRDGYRTTDQESYEMDSRGQKKIFRNTMSGTVVDGYWVRTWGITRDVTERVHLEEQLRNAQQMEAIGRLAGGVAHDFNNILSVIMGHGELLLAVSAGDERARNGLQQIRRAADRAASLTQQLLAFGRKQVLQPRVLDLNDVVADVQKMLSRVIGEDIELVASLHPSLQAVKADPGQVEQVLMNLAINARDAMPQGGKLRMETSNIEVTAEQARDLDLAAGRYVMLRVEDSGEGMDAETLAHIFEPFFTTKPRGKGTGLGLAMVYGIVKQSGGSIHVKSGVGEGTVFRIYFPAAEGNRPQREEVATNGKAPRGTETILVAEDEPDLREVTRIFLEGYGYRVLEAASAEQAIQTAENFREGIDLLLTDVIMPGMSGSQLAEEILSKRPQTRIVYMTGYTDDMVVQYKVLEPGVQLLQKPFTKVDLALKVRATLDGKG